MTLKCRGWGYARGGVKKNYGRGGVVDENNRGVFLCIHLSSVSARGGICDSEKNVKEGDVRTQSKSRGGGGRRHRKIGGGAVDHQKIEGGGVEHSKVG